MSKALPTNGSKLILPDLNLIASETKLVIRKSPKFSPDGFLQTLLSSVSTGQASSNQIAALEVVARTSSIKTPPDFLRSWRAVVLATSG